MKITKREDADEAARAGAVLFNDDIVLRSGPAGWEMFILGEWEPMPAQSGPADGEVWWVIGRTGR